MKKLQVWWVPQVPMKAFEVEVSSVAEGAKVMEVLAAYDLFQFENKVKPDYCNAGGLNQWSDDCDGEGAPGWESWYDDETGEDDPAAWLETSNVELTGGAPGIDNEEPLPERRPVERFVGGDDK